MPGHVKLGAQKGEDPDPEPYLCVSMEMKRENMQKPYDSKKSYWCPDGKGGYVECMVQKKDDKEAEVLIGHIVSISIVSMPCTNKFTLISASSAFLAPYPPHLMSR